LSSSAAIEIVTAFALNELFDLQFSRLDLVKICQKAENEFIGVACGIMDQFAVAMASEEHALQLDCNTLEYEHVPVKLEQSVFIIANTNQQRGLAEGGYNERVKECQRALEIVREHSSNAINTLAEIEPDQSLRDLYEVSSQPLDAMVDAALHAPGTMGSRLTGAGFGGCTISLVETEHLDSWLTQVRAAYEKATDLVVDFYAFQPAAGVSAIDS